MTTVAIVPIETEQGTSFQAVSGHRIALGETAGGALDALQGQFPELGSESLLIVQRFQPDQFFTADQQKRLGELMTHWREARDGGILLPPSDQAELETLIQQEITASTRRAEQAAESLQ